MARDLLIWVSAARAAAASNGQDARCPSATERKSEMKTKKRKAEQAKETDEYTLESWKAERQKLEAEMAADSAQLKAAMEEALANDDLPPEMKKVIRESGSKLLEADEWLREMYDSAEDTIKRCDELIAKVDALEARRGGKAKKTKGKA